MDRILTITVNGTERSIHTDPRRSLLDLLREDLGLTGPKYGCGEGRCGACSVLVDGRAIRSCVTACSVVENKSIVTIEGLANAQTLHPVQEAFVQQGAVQCGYCTAGMILGAVALLEKNATPSDEEIVQAMNGHLCRCNGYPKIVSAIRHASERIKE